MGVGFATNRLQFFFLFSLLSLESTKRSENQSGLCTETESGLHTEKQSQLYGTGISNVLTGMLVRDHCQGINDTRVISLGTESTEVVRTSLGTDM